MKFWKSAAWISALLLSVTVVLSGCAKERSDADDSDGTSHEHTWSDWTVEREPTCSRKGKKVRTCECGEESVRSIDPLEHTYTDGVCEICGEKKPSEGLEFKSNGDGTCAVKGMGTCRDTQLVIPSVSPDGERVTSIAGQAFRSEKLIESVWIPDGVTDIGSYAFSFCYSLVDIRIPTGVTTIGYGAFDNCEALKSIVIPEGVVSIGDRAFSFCCALTSVTLPDTCTTMGKYVFHYCDRLTEITLPNGLTLIGEEMFDSCDSLKTVKIPNSVKEIGEGAFMFCYALTDVVYNGTKAEWQDIYKGYGWNQYSNGFTVHCTDGDVFESES